MKNQAPNNSSRQLKLGPIIAVAVLLIPIAIYVMQPEPEPPVSAVTVVKEKKAPPRFGPGVLTESSAVPTTPADPAAVDPDAPPGLAVTSDQRLLINREMRDVFDYFLLAGASADRSTRVTKLRAHLKAKLPTGAYDEAVQIASNYLAYLTAFEKLMANELNRLNAETTSSPTNTDEAERYSLRMTQISRLRQSMLGAKIAQLWYAEEEASMQQSLIEMRQLNANPQQPNIR